MGKLTILINTIEGLKIHSGIALFKALKKDAKVKFCISSGAGFSIEKLIDKLIWELWKSYLYLYANTQIEEKQKDIDLYKKNFIESNKIETIDSFGDLDSIAYCDQFNVHSYDSFRQSLLKLSKNIFVYTCKINNELFFSKII